MFGIPSDSGAIETLKTAMPGYRVRGFDYGAWFYYDALHCRTMGMFDRGMLRLEHRPLDREMDQATGFPIDVKIRPMSGSPLLADSLRVRWRLAGSPGWIEVPLEPAGTDSFRAEIPWREAGDSVEYYLSAADASGRAETLPPTAPAATYGFTVLENPTAVGPEPARDEFALLTLEPNPFRDLIAVRFAPPDRSPCTLEVFSIRGRRVRTLLEDESFGCPAIRWWDGADEYGRPCAPGVYLVVLRTERTVTSARCVLVR